MHSIRSASLTACAAITLLGVACTSDDTKPASTATSTAAAVAPTTAPAGAPTVAMGPAAVPPVTAAGPGGTVKAIISGFKLPTLTVKAGTVVEFVNQDSTAHTATSDDGAAFDSGSLTQNQTAKFTANKAGTFAYACTIHPDMKGFLIVQ